MAKLIVTNSTTVKELGDEFKKEVGATLRIYDGRSEASKEATLISLGTKVGVFEFGTNRTVGSFCEAIMKNLNLKVKVATADDWVVVLDGLTLNTIKELPKQARKKDMEDFIAYQRKDINAGEKDKEAVVENLEVPAEYKGLPLIIISTKEIDLNESYGKRDFARYPAVGLVQHGYKSYGYQTAVYVGNDYEEVKENLIEFIDNEINPDEDLPKIIKVAEEIDGFGSANDVEEMSDVILCTLNEFYDGGNKHAWDAFWPDWAPEKIIFIIDGEIFLASENGDITPINLTNSQIELLKIFSDLSSLYFSDGLAMFDIKGKYGFINEEGDIVIKPQFDHCNRFEENVAQILKDGLWGLINPKGEYIVKPSLKGMGDIKEGLMSVSVDNLWGYMNTNGEMVIKPQFETAGDFREGLAYVKNGDLYGFINKKGEFIVSPTYTNVDDFRNGFAMVKKDNLWGYINTKGEEVISPQYDDAYPFSGGKAYVTKDGESFDIDVNGNRVD